ncbi:MAG TPA: energy transducer TonB [Bacteroidales bacterium]|nr:energy transducer TonB [Bacteroidales bacterium]HPL03599.1 energy transducer TonB [Bacteroidales bacterium]
MKDNKHDILNNSDCFSEEILIKFVNDELSDDGLAAVENHILNCEICADFVEGILRLENPEDYFKVKQKLNLEISKITSTRTTYRKKRNLSFNSYYKYVAMIAILFVASGVFLIISKINSLKTIKQSQLVQETSSPVMYSDFESEDSLIEEQIAQVVSEPESKDKIQTKSNLVHKERLIVVEDEVAVPSLSDDVIIDEIAINTACEEVAQEKFATLPLEDFDIAEATSDFTKNYAEESPKASSVEKKSAKRVAHRVKGKSDYEFADCEEVKNYETEPVFQGDLEEFIKNNLVYPQIYINDSIETIVSVEFTIDSLGNCIMPRVLNSEDTYFINEAIKLINKMPKWKPATLNSQKVNFIYTLDIEFSLKN